MSQLPMMPVFPDALVADTMHLSAEEFGCYCLLLFATWRNNGKPFSDDHDLAHICRIPLRRWRSHMRDRLAPFFTLSEGKWVQQRLAKEWAKSERKAEISRQNAVSARDTLRDKRLRGSGIDYSRDLFGDSSQIQNSDLKRSNPSVAHAREGNGVNGHDLESKDGPLSSLRSPLKEKKKAQLQQKVMRFAHATMDHREATLAYLGLMGEDQDHSAQWWLDTLDMAMRAQHWDDMQ